ncbi:hypothetical protein AJ80_00599 [Polytolypa hystricis UAMH7299]|uniref:Uncharacterized protein n=1 Tax=Polytolypa hystricis (strain UAMH7299) TaxID=1447883 RepID=A0A2B7Z375_POLH7|nr:hypothetical protein AJ80_00599 [Polytolypa hystricis UAMH7299]
MHHLPSTTTQRDQAYDTPDPSGFTYIHSETVTSRPTAILLSLNRVPPIELNSRQHLPLFSRPLNLGPQPAATILSPRAACQSKYLASSRREREAA